jgi:hypothetical protein
MGLRRPAGMAASRMDALRARSPKVFAVEPAKHSIAASADDD